MINKKSKPINLDYKILVSMIEKTKKSIKKCTWFIRQPKKVIAIGVEWRHK